LVHEATPAVFDDHVRGNVVGPGRQLHHEAAAAAAAHARREIIEE
jgi:hypothetical protein